MSVPPPSCTDISTDTGSATSFDRSTTAVSNTTSRTLTDGRPGRRSCKPVRREHRRDRAIGAQIVVKLARRDVVHRDERLGLDAVPLADRLRKPIDLTRIEPGEGEPQMRQQLD